MLDYCRKMTDVFEREKGEYMQMDIVTRNKANGNSQDNKLIIS